MHINRNDYELIFDDGEVKMKNYARFSLFVGLVILLLTCRGNAVKTATVNKENMHDVLQI
ncbi:hypothetical protein BN990_02863 [Virgibacillus salexigens]|uniref:Uncharacterized protein n=1 Tax=Virgibacillus massiliensis TaxID=1462526 RepID=A0A024QDD3_9BACI|nr:hypothetical protein BN990_02863 [Virgibacillus massiliensis]